MVTQATAQAETPANYCTDPERIEARLRAKELYGRFLPRSSPAAPVQSTEFKYFDGVSLERVDYARLTQPEPLSEAQRLSLVRS